MDLESIADNLARKHELTKEEYLNNKIASLYQDTGGILDFDYYEEIFSPKMLIPKSAQIEQSDSLRRGEYLGNFINFLKEVNPELEKYNCELAYIVDEDETTNLYLSLVHKKGDVSDKWGDISSIIDENPILHEVFQAIGEVYKELRIG